MRDDLRTTKCIKSLLEFITEDIHQANEDFLKSMDKELEFKAIDLTTDFQKLHEIRVLLNKYVSLSNMPIGDYLGI